jgi:uncharacterized protein YcbK (DUF882 family)
VGQTYPSKRTPIFVGALKYVMFRPYCDVPRSITLHEILPSLRAHPDYLQRNNFEIVRGERDDSPIVKPAREAFAALAAGQLRVRQRPGDDNALGLIKFLFPNSHNVYMHSTPARQLFLASKRAFSHGCIRVSDPVALVCLSSGRLFLRRAACGLCTHTGETLTAPYFEGGIYSDACLNQVNYLLRDFRTGESHQIDPSLLDILYEVQALANHDAPFEIISGYRSPKTNAMLHAHSSGVAEHCQHLLGKAVDVRLTGFSMRALGEHARSLSRGGVGFYANSEFVHIDIGKVRFW